ncbi:hypothetical protein TVAG_185250 [Trichomonas vaginalis G3]|uniref:Uncharacterized protein n=1 Tax=Trichomonas vaginalis (strain ATCC PRA-98 / G3) TaxID=412133 RepID=A2D8H0_TRIV3|nr:hypothetical protein TVAGG3_0393140 [Trichomonas vaginalis G3]EAY23219.1 hypothetical protein TVAG_185250 [Trichomonas vaginalis G3]KAI5534132.1 hypothetical protein TVAGG3_0393140 [Trichomonas vaginalis G3]|eukprot:XP_001584205.1 hypothetical protein [Trichomonas vaginalis G3]
MGCNLSNPENKQAAEQEMVIVPFLSTQPRIISSEEYHQTSYFPFEVEEKKEEQPKKKQTYEEGMINHSTQANVSEPTKELYKKQKFNEYFSHIEVSTFQNVPIMSIQSQLNVPSMEYQQGDSLNINDYHQLIDQVIQAVIPPLLSMNLTTKRELTL